MAETTQSHSDDSSAAPSVSLVSRLKGIPVKLIDWMRTSRLRTIIVGCVSLLVLGVVFALWSFLAHEAIGHDDRVTLRQAYEALDDGRYERARTIVGELQNETAQSLSFGSALFILGVVKAKQADDEWSTGRSRAMHLVASRYLQKALAIGLPNEREAAARYQLGRSLILGNQPREGIAVFEELGDIPHTVLGEDASAEAERHALLMQAYLDSPNPRLEKALEHAKFAVEKAHATPRELYKAKLAQGDIFLRLGQAQLARQVVDSLMPPASDLLNESEKSVVQQVLEGRLAIETARQLPKADPQRKLLLNEAINELREAQRNDPRMGRNSRRAMYEIGVALEELGKLQSAVNQFDRVSKQFGDTNEGIAATLAEADLNLAQGRYQQALAGYRTALEAVSNPTTYVNELLSLPELRKRLLAAFQEFVDEGRFAEAALLVDQFNTVFDQGELVELTARTQEAWGESLLKKARSDDRWHARQTRQQGRHRLRAAGRAYEELAQVRYATRFYTDDLWQAADCYYRGQNYTNTARTLREYLHHEVRRRNSVALLRMGQSYLALRRPADAIEAFEECLEMYPRDAVVYQSRLECARAHQQLGNSKAALELLKSNLTGEELTPKSPEWRDSLFAYGRLLYDLDQYEPAVKHLREAVGRYPRDEQSMLAMYTIARAHHRDSEKPQKRLAAANTESERQQSRKQLTSDLEKAHRAYVEVQRLITLEGYGDSDPLHRTLLRNCYMMQGSVLFDLNRFEEARQAYANVSTLYQNEPFVLESFVKIANCFRRLNEPTKARGTLLQAKQVLERLPADADFRVATNFTRQQWGLILDQMSKW
ncbi:tetratricopeptide repeat protein [Adhaeretor mobilis]|uniref:Anaphase-promoting complex, cyclosome, subunit 3 n=1 Tax=Adhaeretor mobilis TaxID=1930276 RepID=A0A517MYU5_9BACT|nr:tetratricopeptide repeat protein [Adhaeretor mobilis]QDT00061.1 Anaphase-promoting complex, cyclosome, subunit 3 [Adhaeretor mobilis]